jgi:putative ABC transport system ATP-binding protein
MCDEPTTTSDPEGSVITLENVSKVYGEGNSAVTALADVSLGVERREFVAVVGQSGSGKSTLLQIIGCLDVPTRGRYALDGVTVSSMDDATLSRLRNERVGFVFQSFNLIPRTTAIENVELPMCYGAARPSRQRARDMLDQVGMGHRADHFPNQLSGGEQQRVAIARALSRSPALLIADEPTGNLDAGTGGQILDLLDQLHREGLTIVMVTHDPVVARRAQRTVTLADGRLASDSASARPVIPNRRA